MNRRIISASLSVIMALNTVTLLPANVFAAAGDSHVYEKDGYIVTYKIG